MGQLLKNEIACLVFETFPKWWGGGGGGGWGGGGGGGKATRKGKTSLSVRQEVNISMTDLFLLRCSSSPQTDVCYIKKEIALKELSRIPVS